MARNLAIKILRTTRAALNTARDASGLLAGELYNITDENTLAIATAVNAYANVTVVGSSPGINQPFTSQTSVTVTHNLGKKPVVSVIDNSGNEIIPLNVNHASDNAFTVTFSVSTTGTIIYTIGGGTNGGIDIVNDTTPQLGGDLDLNGHTFAARTILSTNGTYDFNYILSVTVDTNAVGFGAVLAGAADFHFDEADADAIANCAMIGFALETGTGTKKIGVGYGMLCNTAWNWTGGVPIYLSVTQGTLSQTPVSGEDDVSLVVAFPLSATCIFCLPYSAWVTYKA